MWDVTLGTLVTKLYVMQIYVLHTCSLSTDIIERFHIALPQHDSETI